MVMSLPAHLQSEASPLRRGPRTPPWRGVNLGGWLLLEPGPANGFFEAHPREDGEVARCEWELMRVLQDEGALDALTRHREQHITKKDFQNIKEMGLNAVRIPFGYWVVVGTFGTEPYQGPALQYLDRALDWAEEYGLQVLLDLHGCPGGESPDAPCGRRVRPTSDWSWHDWSFDRSLQVLEAVALRYRDRDVVTGIEVCNEPSNTVPVEILCEFYARAVHSIRSAGMTADRVTVVLPAFQRPLSDVAREWSAQTADIHTNICFDAHYYHCFENYWNGRTFPQHLRAVEERLEELKAYPVMVGEWSLALGDGAQKGCLSQEEMRATFGSAQLSAYQEASHGWFFWNWKDSHSSEWDWRKSHKEGSLTAARRQLPPWNGVGEDPLEDELDLLPADRDIRYGSTVFFRTYHGRYLDIEGEAVDARWADKGDYQQITFLQVSSRPRRKALGASLLHGDNVLLATHRGHLLSVAGNGQLVARAGPANDSSVFVLHTKEGTGVLRHRGRFSLKSKTSAQFVSIADVNIDGRGMAASARAADVGNWQRFVAELVPAEGLGIPAASTPPQQGGLPAVRNASPPKRRASRRVSLVAPANKLQEKLAETPKQRLATLRRRRTMSQETQAESPLKRLASLETQAESPLKRLASLKTATARHTDEDCGVAVTPRCLLSILAEE